MKKNFFLGLSVGAALMSAVLPQSVFAENLHEAVAKALSSHPTVKRAALGKHIADETIKEEQSAYFPSLSASIGGGRLYGDNATSRGLSVTRGTGYSWLWEGNAALNQTIFSWNERGNRVDSAVAQRLSAYHVLDDARQNVAYSAVQAYISLYRAQQLHSAAEKNVANMHDYKKRIAKLVRGGGADAAEESRAGELVLAAENSLVELKGQLISAQAAYIEAVGQKPQSDLDAPSMPFMLNSDKDLDALVIKIRKAHPQIKAMQRTIDSLEHTARAESKDPLPDLGSELSYTKRDQRDIIGGESTDARAMLRLSWNLDTGGAQFARTRRANLQHQDAVTELEELQRTVERNVRVSLAGLEVARQQRDIQERRHGELVSTLKTYTQQFKASKKRLIDVMQAESQEFAAYNDYMNAKFTMLDAAYGFLASQGNITDAISILSMKNQKQSVSLENDLSKIKPAAGSVIKAQGAQLAPQRDVKKEAVKHISHSQVIEMEKDEKTIAHKTTMPKVDAVEEHGSPIIEQPERELSKAEDTFEFVPFKTSIRPYADSKK
jgi:outer membrane protein TolC